MSANAAIHIQNIPSNPEVQIVLPSISSKHSQVRPHASHECVHAQNAKYSSFRSRNLAAYQTFYVLNDYSEKDRIQASKATAMLVGGAPLPGVAGFFVSVRPLHLDSWHDWPVLQSASFEQDGARGGC